MDLLVENNNILEPELKPEKKNKNSDFVIWKNK